VSGTVLVVDDQPSVRRLIREVLGDLAAIAEAPNGDRALAVAEAHPPDVAILDMNMPGRDGLETLAILRSRHPCVKAVVLSGTSESGELERALQEGACCVLSKPFDVGRLREVVAGLLGSRADASRAAERRARYGAAPTSGAGAEEELT